jgi:hypothetical protein
MNLIYVIGYPGVGKSTAVAQALQTLGYLAGVQHEQPIPHIAWHNEKSSIINELGRRRDNFSGTDALALNIQPKATAWLEQRPDGTFIAEGDRLANGKFFDVASRTCERFVIAHIDAPLEIAQTRAQRRAERLNIATQNDSWWRGRATKVTNLVSAYRDRVVTIDAQRPRLEIAGEIVDLLTA